MHVTHECKLQVLQVRAFAGPRHLQHLQHLVLQALQVLQVPPRPQGPQGAAWAPGGTENPPRRN